MPSKNAAYSAYAIANVIIYSPNSKRLFINLLPIDESFWPFCSERDAKRVAT